MRGRGAGGGRLIEIDLAPDLDCDTPLLVSREGREWAARLLCMRMATAHCCVTLESQRWPYSRGLLTCEADSSMSVHIFMVSLLLLCPDTDILKRLTVSGSSPSERRSHSRGA